jgi:APA family basic amino acid/polyamine antiporter
MDQPPAAALPAKPPLGFWPALALVVGNMIGSGIYLLPASLAPLGANALWGWVITLIGATGLAFIFARLSARLPLAGGPYAYADAAFGPVVGFATAWSYWVLIWAGNGAIAVAIVSALSLVFPALTASSGLPAFAAVALVWLLVLVNLRGAKLAGRVQVVTTLLKLLPLVGVIMLAGWLLFSRGGAAIVDNPPVPLAFGTVAGAAALTFWGFLGVESATVPADKVRDAARIVPRATMIGIALTGAVYLAVSTAIAIMMPMHVAAQSPAPVAAFLGGALGPAAADVVAIFAAISAFGALNGFVLLQGEMPWAMAKGGVFPAWFGKEDRRGTPVRAHIVSGILVTIVTLANYTRGMGDLFAFVASVSLAAGMLAYFVSALAAAKLLRDEAAVRVIGILAALFVGWMSWGLGWEANSWALVLLLAGIPVYWLVRRARTSGR